MYPQHFMVQGVAYSPQVQTSAVYLTTSQKNEKSTTFKPNSTCNTPHLTNLPVELLFSVCKYLIPKSVALNLAAKVKDQSSSILETRRTCKLLNEISTDLLIPVVFTDLLALKNVQSELETHLAEIQVQVQPAMAYNLQFMDACSATQLTELSWLTRPKLEIQQVVAAFVYLISPKNVKLNTWSEISRCARSNKHWLKLLQASVPHASHAGHARARALIANMNITYARIKAISVPAHDLLVVVAAYLAYMDQYNRVVKGIAMLDKVRSRVLNLDLFTALARSTVQTLSVDHCCPLELNEVMANVSLAAEG